MKQQHINILTVTFALIVIGIIAFANQGGSELMFRIVHSIPYGDKFFHFLLIGVLCLLINLSMSARTWRIGRYQLLAGSILLSIPVILEEVSQIFLPQRSFDLLDLTADFVGVLFFGHIAILLIKRRDATQHSTMPSG